MFFIEHLVFIRDLKLRVAISGFNLINLMW